MEGLRMQIFRPTKTLKSSELLTSKVTYSVEGYLLHRCHVHASAFTGFLLIPFL